MSHASLPVRVLTSFVRDARACLGALLMGTAAVTLPPALNAAQDDARLVVLVAAIAFSAGAFAVARSRALNVEGDSLRLVTARVVLSVVGAATAVTALIGLAASGA